MRSLAVLFGALVLAACGTAPVTRNESPTGSPTQTATPEVQKQSRDSVSQYLLTSAATDFHKNVRSDSLRFREVRLGHLVTPSGEEQHLLCGQFLSAQESGKVEWAPFATIKTSGFEQWNGAQAEFYCKRSSITWDKDDLSSALQSRFENIRVGTESSPR